MPLVGPLTRRRGQRVAVGVGVVAEEPGRRHGQGGVLVVCRVVDRDRGVVDGAATLTVTVAGVGAAGAVGDGVGEGVGAGEVRGRGCR